MKLIKLKEDHYVVVDDSEIKEGDWLLDTIDNTIWGCYKDMSISLFPECKKITHSTQPLEYIEDKDEFGTHQIQGFDKIQYLPLQEVKELIGIDVEEKAKAEYKDNLHNPFFTAAPMGYVKGYNQAVEDNKENKYTEFDIIKAFEYGWNQCFYGIKDEEVLRRIQSNFIQSLQPKTDWEVEIVDGKLKLLSKQG